MEQSNIESSKQPNLPLISISAAVLLAVGALTIDHHHPEFISGFQLTGDTIQEKVSKASILERLERFSPDDFEGEYSVISLEGVQSQIPAEYHEQWSRIVTWIKNETLRDGSPYASGDIYAAILPFDPRHNDFITDVKNSPSFAYGAVGANMDLEIDGKPVYVLLFPLKD